MFIIIGTVAFFILLFNGLKYRKRSYQEFIAESADDNKEVEIKFFWDNMEVATTKPLREEVIASQSLYYLNYQKARNRILASFIIFICSMIVELILH